VIPELDSYAEQIYEQMAPLAFADEENGWPLLHLCAANGSLYQPVEDLVRDQGDAPGWSQLVDVDRCPDDFLPWLAQLPGVQLDYGATAESMRNRIRSTDGAKRGGANAFRGAASPHLTGERHVFVHERDGSPWRVTVVTRTSETPDPAAVLAALLAQKPAGIVLEYSTVDGEVWDEIDAGTSWDDLDPGVTWDDLDTTTI
jgi:hypothetical protein